MKYHSMLLCLALALAPGAAPAELYKWVDGDGKTHYSDKPPAEAEARPGTVEAEVNIVDPVAVPAPGEAEPARRTAPAPAQRGTARARAVEEQISECEQQWRTYNASVACFNACSVRVFNYRQGRVVRSTEMCGHCTNLPKPKCKR